MDHTVEHGVKKEGVRARGEHESERETYKGAGGIYGGE